MLQFRLLLCMVLVTATRNAHFVPEVDKTGHFGEDDVHCPGTCSGGGGGGGGGGFDGVGWHLACRQSEQPASPPRVRVGAAVEAEEADAFAAVGGGGTQSGVATEAAAAAHSSLGLLPPEEEGAEPVPATTLSSLLPGSPPRVRTNGRPGALESRDGFYSGTSMAILKAESNGPPLPPYSLPTLHLDSEDIKRARARVGWRRGPRALIALGALHPFGKRVVRAALRLLHMLLWAPLTLARARRPHRPLPPLPSDHTLLRQSARQLAALIREGKVSSEAVVAAYARRVREVNPAINAVVDERFVAAVEEARKADAEVAAATEAAGAERDAALRRLADSRPLLGVPVTVKESVAVEGLSHCAGQLSLGGRRASEDAEAVRRLRAAGAIPLLVSNCPELCMHYETYNRVTGRTRNPHDTRRTSGGSSGGEAALLGAGASVIGVGSDIGGSSRLPAMFTGVFGHKPTAGVISDIGHWPRSDDKDWWRFFTLGPMTRYAEDLKLMLKIMANDDALPHLQLDKDVNVSELKVFYIESDGGLTTGPLSSDILSGMHRAVQHLTTVCKVPPQKIYLKELKYAMDLTAVCLFRMKGVPNVFQVDEDPEEWKSVSLEWLKFFLGLSQASFYALIYGPLKWLFGGVPADQVSKYLNILDSLRSQIEEILQDNGVILYPTFIQSAPYHGEMYFYFLSGMYCSIFNVLQIPATNCPIGKSKNGLPIGIQIAAAPYRDRLSLAVAEELSKTFGGWVEPS